MPELQSLRIRLQALLAKRRGEVREEKLQLEEEMKEKELQRLRFNELAGPLFTEIIEPRLKLLADQFDDAEYELPGGRHHGIVTFNKDRRFSASVELSFHITFDDKGTVCLEYCPKILPILMDFKRKESLSFPLDQIDESKIIMFVDDTIVLFVGTYLKLQGDPKYRRENMVTDPVCKMTFNKFIASVQTKYEGKTYYFRVPSCLEKFQAEPEKYAGSVGNNG